MTKLRLALINVGRMTANFLVVTPPLGLLSLAAYVRREMSAEILVIDQWAENLETSDVMRRVAAFAPDVVGFHALTASALLLAEMVRAARKAVPGAWTVLGGPHVSAVGAQVMEDTAADAAVVGEGELSLERILLARRDGGGMGDIPGLIWRNGTQEIVTNPGSLPYVEDLDSLPFPAYDLIDLNVYRRARSMAQVPPRRYITMMTSRGCPYSCMYCHNIFGKRFRSQSAERIVDEICHFISVFKVSEFEFVDDIFNCDPKRLAAFADLVAKRNVKIRICFPNALRCDILTEDSVEALVSAGTYYTACALETGSPRIQKLVKKNLNIPRFLQGVDMLAKRGVYTHGFTMFGFPTETEEEMNQTIDVACGSQLHTATFFTVTPYANTALYAWAQENRPEQLAAISHENSDYTGIRVNLSDVRDEVLFSCQRRAWRKFYLNPKRIMRIVRVFPRPYYLPAYLPLLTRRLFNRV